MSLCEVCRGVLERGLLDRNGVGADGEGNAVKWGKLSKASRILLSVPFSSEVRLLLSFGHRE